ncbi:MAG: hypothetical protein JJ992_01700 [Planctomycetes bacterium]|nr:hypothetical protein [Planctomycetota bacterium]
MVARSTSQCRTRSHPESSGWRWAIRVLVVTLICCRGLGGAERDPDPTADGGLLPSVWEPGRRSPLLDALGVWRRGGDYFPNNVVYADDGRGAVDGGDAPFVRIDRRTGRFLKHPHTKPAVQFGCAVIATPYEDALEQALLQGSDETKLQALVVLMRLRASHSVPEQWKTLQYLQQRDDRPEWQPLLVELESCFAPERLMKAAALLPPKDDYLRPSAEYEWTLRALGVIAHRPALPRLTELSRHANLHTSLAAERSLEDFTGEEANDALESCLLGWRYDAYLRAAHALLKRDPDRLHRVLRDAKAPEEARYQVGLSLARFDDPAAVPILCEQVPRIAIKDAAMFQQISRLGLPEHREMIDSLPRRVREEQRPLAEQAVKQYHERLSRPADKKKSE